MVRPLFLMILCTLLFSPARAQIGEYRNEFAVGVGGGFIMVPAMIYLLRIPTSVVVGTSLFQIIFVSTYSTIVQAVVNQTVDIVLAFILMLSGVVAAQYGVRAGRKLKAEQLRALLALLILAVGVRLAIDPFATPADIFSIVRSGATR